MITCYWRLTRFKIILSPSSFPPYRHHVDMAIHSRNSSLSSLASVSPALSTSSLPKTDSSRTNTLAVTQIPRAFFEPIVLDALREYFEGFGEIHTWAPLKAFARIIVVYYDEEAVELAKEGSDGLFIDTGDAL